MGYRAIARPSSLPRVRGVGVERVCIRVMFGFLAVGDRSFRF